jgi:hypothetical protein
MYQGANRRCLSEHYPWHLAVAIADVIMNTRTGDVPTAEDDVLDVCGDVTYRLDQVAIASLNTVFAQRATCEDHCSNQVVAMHCHVLLGWSDDIGLLVLQACMLAAAFRQGTDYVSAPFPLHVCAHPCLRFGLHGRDRGRLPVARVPPSTNRMGAVACAPCAAPTSSSTLWAVQGLPSGTAWTRLCWSFAENGGEPAGPSLADCRHRCLQADQLHTTASFA